MSTSVATSVDDELLRTRLTCFSFSFFHATHWHHCDPIFCSSQPTPRVLVALFLLFLVLALRSEVSVLILNMLDLRATRSVVRATTPEYALKTNLNSVEFPLCSRGLPFTNVFPDTFTIQPVPPQLFRHAFRIKTTGPAPQPCVMK